MGAYVKSALIKKTLFMSICELWEHPQIFLEDSYGWIMRHKALNFIMPRGEEGIVGCCAAAIITKLGICNLLAVCKLDPWLYETTCSGSRRRQVFVGRRGENVVPPPKVTHLLGPVWDCGTGQARYMWEISQQYLRFLWLIPVFWTIEVLGGCVFSWWCETLWVMVGKM